MDNLTPEQIKLMINMLQDMLPKENTTSVESPKPKKEQRTNRFVDMPESTMHKEDIAIDRKLNVREPVARTRQFRPIGVQCRVCGRKENVNPALIPESLERYKCNKCSSSPG